MLAFHKILDLAFRLGKLFAFVNLVAKPLVSYDTLKEGLQRDKNNSPSYACTGVSFQAARRS